MKERKRWLEILMHQSQGKRAFARPTSLEEGAAELGGRTSQGVRYEKREGNAKISVVQNVDAVLLYPVIRAAVRYLGTQINQADSPSLPHQ